MTWAHRQPWSNGKVGMQGGSYLGIEQLFAAEQRPPGLKAIFPTGAAIGPGHRLRLAIQGFDVPHLAPQPADGVKTLGPMTIHTGRDHPSSVTMPVRQ